MKITNNNCAKEDVATCVIFKRGKNVVSQNKVCASIQYSFYTSLYKIEYIYVYIYTPVHALLAFVMSIATK